MRADMAEEKRRKNLDNARANKIEAKLQAIKDKENEHNQKVRMTYREQVADEDMKTAERRVIMKQMREESKVAAMRRQQDTERLTRLREQNIRLKEEAWLARAHTGGVLNFPTSPGGSRKR